MSYVWKNPAAPTFAKLVNGAVVRLSTELPEFDEETAGLHDLSVADRVTAGWYAVAAHDFPAPDPFVFEIIPVSYELTSSDDRTGAVVLSPVFEKKVADMAAIRRMEYERVSDALVIRAMRLQLAGDPGADAAKDEALAKVAEIKARIPDLEAK
jgi:hypothetical protein